MDALLLLSIVWMQCEESHRRLSAVVIPSTHLDKGMAILKADASLQTVW